jgi:hypothetical protein
MLAILDKSGHCFYNYTTLSSSFGEEEIGLRKKLLGQTFNNRENARQLIQLIW